MKEIRERLIELREKLDLTQREFAEMHDLSRGQLGQIETGHNKPPLELLQSVTKKHGVRWEWIVEGIPPVLKGDVKNVDNKLTTTITVDESGMDNIVMVDVKAAAGYVTGLSEPSYFKKLPAFKLPGAQFHNATFRAFQVDGDSMYDTLDHDDWVISRYLESFNSIKEGYIHVIVCTNEIWVKRILNRVNERGKLVLISDNDFYPTKEIDIIDVLEIWLVKGKLGFNLRSRKKDLWTVINKLQSDVSELQTKLKSK